MRVYAPALRMAWGALLLGAPRFVLEQVGAPDRRRATVAVTRLLGGRHVVQGGLTLLAPTAPVRPLGALADTLHATSAVALAVASRRWRRVGCADALLAAGFAVIG